MSLARQIRALVCAAALGTSACAGTPTAPPEPEPVGVLEAWHDALVAGKPEQAYALLGPELRRELSREAFLTVYQRQRDALIAQARQLLTHTKGHTPEQQAEVRIRNATARLVRGPDGWRLTEPVRGPSPQK